MQCVGRAWRIAAFGLLVTQGFVFAQPARPPGAAASAQSTIVLRRDFAELAAGTELAAEAVSIEGIAVRPPSGDGALVVAPWDVVGRIEGPMAARAEWMSAAGEKAWRAISRLERGDTTAAEPLLEELFTLYAGRRGVTSERIAGGLLACRLQRGAVAGAVTPWLAWFNARTGSAPASLDIVAGYVDPATGLSPGLPPVWLDLPSTGAMARAPWLAPPADSEPLAPAALDLAALYEQSVRREAGFEAMLPPERSADPAVRLVREMVASRVSPPDRRAEARAALLKMLESRPPAWTEAWIRAAVGRSLLMESDRESRLLGIAQLAHIPARLSRESPYLTGVAIAEMAVAVAELGDAEGGVVLRQELASGYGGHPALEWAPLRALAAPPARATAPKADSADSNADPITGEGGPN